jgi:hypothetical protein
MKDYSNEPPSELGKKLLELLGRPIIAKIDEGGLTDEYLVNKAKEEFEATDKEGHPNWAVRQNARKDIHALKGHYPNVTSATFIQQNFQQNNLTITPVVRGILEQHMKMLTSGETVDAEVDDGDKGTT